MAVQENSPSNTIPTPEPPHDDPCIVHRPLDMKGGGEEYVFQLARVLDAPLYTYRCTIDTPDDVQVVEFGDGSILERLPEDFLKIEYADWSPPEKHDCVITSSSLALPTMHLPHQHRIHLCHTPARWLYDLQHRRDDNILVKAYKAASRTYNETTARRVDDWITNSEIIARRVDTYYNETVTDVIHPPVEVNEYHAGPNHGYLLYLGRLEPHKGVREIVEELSETDHSVKVAGTGSLEDDLREQAADNIEFLGYVSEERKKDLLARADSLIFNSYREDFGIVPVEGLASGTPVIGVDEGYTSYQITDADTGVLFERGRLLKAVERRYELEFDAERLQQAAARYGMDRFQSEWRGLIYDE